METTLQKNPEQIPEIVKRERSKGMKAFIIIMVISILLATTISSAVSGINGNDFWWHQKVGEWICENGEVPTKDIFSWYGTANDFDWTAHEWLSDVLFYKAYTSFGEQGVWFIVISLACLLGLLMLFEVRKKITINPVASFLFFGLLGFVFSYTFLIRPQIFSFYLTFFTLKILYDYMEEPEKKKNVIKLFILPFIAVLWSNLHGGNSPFAYLFPGACFFASLFRFKFGNIEAKKYSNKSKLLLGIVTILCILCILINPIGIKVLLYPFQNLSDDVSMKAISEWASPDAKITYQLVVYFVPVILFAVMVLCQKEKVRLVDVIMMLAMMVLFFRSVRFITLWYIASLFFGWRYMFEVKPFKKPTDIGWKSILCIVLIVIAAVPAGFFVCDAMWYSNGVGQKEVYITKTVSEEMIQLIKNTDPQRIFNDYNVGDALIANDIQPFYDARADLFGQDDILATGFSLQSMSYIEDLDDAENPNMDKDILNAQANIINDNGMILNGETTYARSFDVEYLVNKYDFDYILILNSRPLNAYLYSHQERYELLAFDDMISYYRVLPN